MRVLKFGGTSVGEPERIRTVVDLVARRRHERLVVVLSAAAGVTDRLARLGAAAAAGQADEAAAMVTELRRRQRDLVHGVLGRGGSEINLSFVLDEAALPEAVSRLHRRFFPAATEVRRAG